MLVISRKKGEAILIGEPPNQIEMIVLEIRSEKVRVGFHGNEKIFIRRAELAVPKCEWCGKRIAVTRVICHGEHKFCSVNCKLDCLSHYDAERPYDIER